MKNAELHAIDSKWNNQPYHIKIKVPPLGATFIKIKKETMKKEVIKKETTKKSKKKKSKTKKSDKSNQ